MTTQNLVANLYNPHEQTKEQLIASFVVRRNVFQKLFKEIKSSDMKYPEQHFLIVGQRGMGKTTLLLRLGYEVENDSELSSWLIPLVLKEESYWGITRLFKLWETIAKELESKDKNFSRLFTKMETAYSENEDYERIIFDILIQELQTHSRKLLLFIDNLAEMFRNFSDMECHRLREILMTCPHMRIIGATAIVLEAFFKYEHAFYEFFKKEHLEGLNKEEARCLLQQLAKTDAEKKTIAHILEHQQGRAEALRIMTGGVIRTIILLFEIFIDNENGNAIGDLESILDRVTPLYKHRMDDFAPVQREVINAIALNWDAVSTEEIAKKMRMKTEEILPVLQGLDKVEMIQRVETDTQMNLYFLKERFFNIWYLMRVAPKGSQNKVIWLVRFLESWYDKDELIERAKRHIDMLCKGNYHPKGAYYLTEALVWTGKLDMDIEHELIANTRIFLEKNHENLAEEISQSDFELLMSAIQYYQKNNDIIYSILQKIRNKTRMCLFIGRLCHKLNKYELAEKLYLMAIESGDIDAIITIGYLYETNYNDYDRAEKYYLMAAEKNNDEAFYRIGNLYCNKLYNFEKAEKYYLMAIEKKNILAMYMVGLLYYHNLSDYEKAEKYILMAAENDLPEAMYFLGLFYKIKNNYEKSEKYYLMAFEKGYLFSSFGLANLFYYNLKDYDRAEKYCVIVIKNIGNFKNEEAIQILTIYLSILFIRKEYHKIIKYFENIELNLEERFKPLYYALLHFTNSKNFHKMPPELAEPVKDIIEKVKQMAVDYA